MAILGLENSKRPAFKKTPKRKQSDAVTTDNLFSQNFNLLYKISCGVVINPRPVKSLLYQYLPEQRHRSEGLLPFAG